MATNIILFAFTGNALRIYPSILTKKTGQNVARHLEKFGTKAFVIILVCT